MAHHRSQGIVIALLLGTLALIAYGSLYPFDLQPRARTHTLTQAFLELSWARAGRSDRIANILLYAPLGFCLLLWADGRMRRISAVALTIVIGALLSFSVEVAQVFIAQRVPSWWDVVFNTIGAFVGATAGLAWRELANRMRTTHTVSRTADRSAVLVVVLFLAWRFAPYTPQFNLGKLKAAFAPLADPYFSIAEMGHHLVWWILLASIVFKLASPQRSVETLLVLIAAVLTSCLVIAGHGFIPSELLALMLLLPSLFVFNRLRDTPRHWILLAAVVGLIVYDSFYPFKVLATAEHFDLWPFSRWMAGGFPVDWQWLARRACYFAAFAWVLKEAGISLRTTIVVVPFGVLLIEIAQIWLFGQRATITEPLLALLVVGMMLGLDGSTIRRPAHSR